MASRSLPIPFRQAHKRNLSAAAVPAPSLRTAVMVFIAVLILFRWLHLILALQITSTSRQFQISTDELAKIERQNALLQEQIAAAESPRVLAGLAAQLGYGPRTPVYIQLGASAVQPAGDALPADTGAVREAAVSPTAIPIEGGSASAFGTWLDTQP